MAVDHPRSMAAYKVAAKGDGPLHQYMVGLMYHKGQGVDVDYKQARVWFEKAAAQNYAITVNHGSTTRGRSS